MAARSLSISTQALGHNSSAMAVSTAVFFGLAGLSSDAAGSKPDPVTETSKVSEMVRRARCGESEAIAWLYDRFVPAIHDVAIRLMGSRDDAEDVVHDVFVALPKTLRSFEGRGSFEGWLKRVGARIALMKLRRRRIMGEVAISESLARISHDDPSSVVDRLTVQSAIRSLPEPLRVVFVLKEVEGYTHLEISHKLNIPVNTSKTRLFRCRELLRERLESSKC